MLKLLTISMFVGIGLGLVASIGILMCGRVDSTPVIRPEPVEIRPVERREAVIHAGDRRRTYNPLDDM